MPINLKAALATARQQAYEAANNVDNKGSKKFMFPDQALSPKEIGEQEKAWGGKVKVDGKVSRAELKNGFNAGAHRDTFDHILKAQGNSTMSVDALADAYKLRLETSLNKLAKIHNQSDGQLNANLITEKDILSLPADLRRDVILLLDKDPQLDAEHRALFNRMLDGRYPKDIDAK